jgi:hypothetical protein
MPYSLATDSLDGTKLTNLSQLTALANRVKSELDAAATDATNAIKYAVLDGANLKLYTTKYNNDTAALAATADFTLNIPAEMFLDQAKTQFVEEFHWDTWSTGKTGTANGEDIADVDLEDNDFAAFAALEGKPVMVLAVATDSDGAGSGANTISYSLLDMSKLVDTYTVASGDSAKVLSISGYTVSFNISADAGNILEAKSDGLYATARVAGATNGNLASFDSNGNVQDSNVAAADVVTKVTGSNEGKVAKLDANGKLAAGTHDEADLQVKIASPTADNLVSMDASGLVADSGIAKSTVQTQITNGTVAAGNVVTMDANGFVQNSGVALATDNEINTMITGVFGASA